MFSYCGRPVMCFDASGGNRGGMFRGEKSARVYAKAGMAHIYKY